MYYNISGQEKFIELGCMFEELEQFWLLWIELKDIASKNWLK